MLHLKESQRIQTFRDYWSWRLPEKTKNYTEENSTTWQKKNSNIIISSACCVYLCILCFSESVKHRMNKASLVRSYCRTNNSDELRFSDWRHSLSIEQVSCNSEWSAPPQIANMHLVFTDDKNSYGALCNLCFFFSEDAIANFSD
jgi:hypothetical protein